MTIIKCAAEIGDDIRGKLSELLVEGFNRNLKSYSKNKEKLMKTFEHTFVLDNIYVSIIENEVVGMIACTPDDGTAVMKPNR